MLRRYSGKVNPKELMAVSQRDEYCPAITDTHYRSFNRVPQIAFHQWIATEVVGEIQSRFRAIGTLSVKGSPRGQTNQAAQKQMSDKRQHSGNSATGTVGRISPFVRYVSHTVMTSRSL